MTIFSPTDSSRPEQADEAFAQGASRWIGDESNHAALWFDDIPPVAGKSVGTLGSFSADSPESAGKLIAKAEEEFRQQGVDYLLGPMNGNTWRKHRFVIESSGRAPFLFEPRNPEAYPDYFQAAGFHPVAHYSSGLVDLGGPRPNLEKIIRGLDRRGVSTRIIDLENFEQDLDAIFEISLASFHDNFLYTPFSREEFLAVYGKVRPHIIPEFVRLAIREGTPVGFLFALPDLEAAQRNEQPAVILKTLAALPDRRLAGLGSLLVDEVQQAAKSLGYQEAIHALQHENNTSLRLSSRFDAKIFRRYALYAKDLA